MQYAHIYHVSLFRKTYNMMKGGRNMGLGICLDPSSIPAAPGGQNVSHTEENWWCMAQPFCHTRLALHWNWNTLP